MAAGGDAVAGLSASLLRQRGRSNDPVPVDCRGSKTDPAPDDPRRLRAVVIGESGRGDGEEDGSGYGGDLAHHGSLNVHASGQRSLRRVGMRPHASALDEKR
jgi:hypothetical protein